MSSSTTESLPPHVEVGGWLLGALEPDEARAFEVHLASCAQCLAEVEQLRPMVESLDAIADDADVPPMLADRTLGAVRDAAASTRSRRRWITRGIIAAAAAVILVGVTIWLLPGPTKAKNIDFALVSPTHGAPVGTAAAHSTTRGWNIHLLLRGLPDLTGRGFYECWYVDPAKETRQHPFRVSAGTFKADQSGKADVHMWSWADPHKFPVMEVTAEPLDGNPAATGPVVLSGVAQIP